MQKGSAGRPDRGGPAGRYRVGGAGRADQGEDGDGAREARGRRVPGDAVQSRGVRRVHRPAVGGDGAQPAVKTAPNKAMPSVMPSWRKVLTAPPAMPARCGGTASMRPRPDTGVASPTPTPITASPAIERRPARESSSSTPAGAARADEDQAARRSAPAGNRCM